MKILILNLLYCLINMDGANILAIFPLKLKSHFAMFGSIIDGLTQRGHQVDLYSFFPKENKNITNFNLQNFSLMEGGTPEFPIQNLRALPNKNCMNLMFFEAGSCRPMLNSTMFRNLRDTNKRYDLMIAELFAGECYFMFAHHFGIPSVGMTSSVDLPWGGTRIGNPDNPSYIPHYFSNYLPAMNFLERIVNTFTLIEYKIRHSRYINEQNLILKQFFGPNIPELTEVLTNTSLILVNSHFSINQPIPTLPNFKEVGGLHIKKPKPLDQSLKSVINNEKFIYFSLGSIAFAELFPKQNLEIILNAFKKLNIRVIWKGKLEKFPSDVVLPNNVKVFSWIPQLDILCDPNLLLFITHSGLMSTQEATYCGVPMLSFPLFADQYLNAKNIVNRGMGIEIDLLDSTEDKLTRTIQELINNPKYKVNSQIYSQKFKERPVSPLYESIFWIEYLIKYPNSPELKSEARHLSWFQYYLLDIILSVMIVVVCLVGLLFWITRVLLKNYNSVRVKDKTL